MTLHLDVTTQKKVAGKGPYPDFVEAFAQLSPKRAEQPMGPREMVRQRVAMMLFGLHCFLRIYGVGGLERWIVRRFSVSHAWRARAERRRAKRFYRESRLRGRYVVDKKHGSWVFGSGDWRAAEGPCVEGRQHGHWIERDPDGDVEYGPDVQGERRGKWVKLLADGRVAEAHYENGKRRRDWMLQHAGPER